MPTEKFRPEDDELGYYFVLNIQPNATPEEIELAYYEERDAWSAYESEEAKERLKRIEAAYAVLSEPRLRAFYDASSLEKEHEGVEDAQQDLTRQWSRNVMTAPHGDTLVAVPVRQVSKLELAQESFHENRWTHRRYALINGLLTPTALLTLSYYVPHHALWAVPLAVGLFALTVYAGIKSNGWKHLADEWKGFWATLSVSILGRVQQWGAVITAIVALVIALLFVLLAILVIAVALLLFFGIASAVAGG